MKKFEIIRNGSCSIHEQLLSGLTEYINNALPGTRVPSETALCRNYGLARKTVSKALNQLKEQGLIERRRGSGTYISASNTNTTIYFLIPHPIHLTLQSDASLQARRILYGASMCKNGNLIQPLPVSQKLESPLMNIDWKTVKQIPQGAKVCILGLWFQDLFPFLLERKVQGIFLDSQYDKSEYYDENQEIIRLHWNTITIDRSDAIERAVKYLHGLEKSRIVMVKSFLDEPFHPFRKGFKSGFKSVGLIFNDNYFLEISHPASDNLIKEKVIELWNKTHFNALIWGISDKIKVIYDVITKDLKLRIPEDIALISYFDNPSYLDFKTPISAITQPFVNIGKEVVRIFNTKGHNLERITFQSSIIERQSTKKGVCACENSAFVLEKIKNHDVFASIV